MVVAGAVGILLNWLAGAVSVSLFYSTPYIGTVKTLAAFLPADVIKLAIAAVVATAVHRAFPQLLGRG